jgi:hypothetical protein
MITYRAKHMKSIAFALAGIFVFATSEALADSACFVVPHDTSDANISIVFNGTNQSHVLVRDTTTNKEIVNQKSGSPIFNQPLSKSKTDTAYLVSCTYRNNSAGGVENSGEPSRPAPVKTLVDKDNLIVIGFDDTANGATPDGRYEYQSVLVTVHLPSVEKAEGKATVKKK